MRVIKPREICNGRDLFNGRRSALRCSLGGNPVVCPRSELSGKAVRPSPTTTLSITRASTLAEHSPALQFGVKLGNQ